VKITGTAKPGEIIFLEAQITGRLGNLIQTQATAKVGGEIILTAELTLGGAK
jgi:3-hydroxymyristoyl/3-hydroxydecanoyl-(acyl carrier protein) dehydratase